jgi:hypothetical protein
MIQGNNTLMRQAPNARTLQDSVKLSKPDKELDGVEAHDESLLTKLRNSMEILCNSISD